MIITDEIHKQIHSLRATGLSQDKIAVRLGISQHSVSRSLNPQIAERDRAGSILHYWENAEASRNRAVNWRADHPERGAIAMAKYRELHPDRVALSIAKHRANHKTDIAESKAKYRASHKEQIALASHEYYVDHKDALNAQRREYYQEHREEELAKTEQYNDAHKEERLDYAVEYYKTHKKQRDDYNREYRETHAEERKTYKRTHRSEDLANTQKRNALKKGATVGNMEEITDVYRIAREQKRVRCYLCGALIPLGERHVDHIIPLSKGGSHSAKNLAVTCKQCNLSKGAKIPMEIGRLL